MVGQLSAMVEHMKEKISVLSMNIEDESVSQNESDRSEESLEMKANPWIWTGSRRPRPVEPYLTSDKEKNPPRNLKSLLQQVLVQDIAIENWLRKRPVLISSKQTIERALYKIMKHDVHSLPVADANGEVFGIIDIEDIAKPIINLLIEDPLTGVIRVNSDVMGRPVSSLFLTQENRTYLLGNKTPLWNAMGHFLRINVRRFLIVDRIIREEAREQTFPENKIDGLFTQSDIVRFLASNPTWMKKEPIFQKSLKEIGLGNRAPLIISHLEFAGTAFSMLQQQKRTSAAIVNAEGKLFATLSLSDLKGLTRKNSYVLNLPLHEFFQHDKKRPWWERPTCVELSSSLFETILNFSCTRRHVVYIIDKNTQKPVAEVGHRETLVRLMSLM